MPIYIVFSPRLLEIGMKSPNLLSRLLKCQIIVRVILNYFSCESSGLIPSGQAPSKLLKTRDLWFSIAIASLTNRHFLPNRQRAKSKKSPISDSFSTHLVEKSQWYSELV